MSIALATPDDEPEDEPISEEEAAESQYDDTAEQENRREWFE